MIIIFLLPVIHEHKATPSFALWVTRFQTLDKDGFYVTIIFKLPRVCVKHQEIGTIFNRYQTHSGQRCWEIKIFSSYLLINKTQSFVHFMYWGKKYMYPLINTGCYLLKKKGRKQMTVTHQETLPAGNDAACPHQGNWLCMYLNMNKYKIVTNDCN